MGQGFLTLLVACTVWQVGLARTGQQEHRRAVDQPSGSRRERADGPLEYVPNVGREVAIDEEQEEGCFFIYGHLDARGNFLRDVRRPVVMQLLTPAGPYPDPGMVINFCAFEGEPVYEFRSGYLIRGVFRSLGAGFIPDVGSRVIAFKDYRPGKGVPRIYNLPGSFVKRKK